MGETYGCICKSCKKEYSIHLGLGEYSLPLKFIKGIYICKKCGCWEETNMSFSRLYEDSNKNDENEIETNPMFKEMKSLITEYDPHKKCPDCNNEMEATFYLEIEGNIISPKIICKECKSRLKLGWMGLWD
jgi:hypothetical protein